MIAAAVVCAAVAVQAASFTWKTKASNGVYLPGSTDKLGSATAYLFDSATVGQSSLVTAFAAGTLDLASLSELDIGTVSSSNIAKSDSIEYGSYPNTYDLYYALINDGKLYISDVQTYVTVNGGDDVPLQFQSKASSQAAAMDAKAGYKAAGWYTAVPEPTSGLLLLLGVAGLALRRRRA